MIAATITRPGTAARGRASASGSSTTRCALRGSPPRPRVFAQLKRDLAVAISAEALFSLMDLCGLDAEEAVASATRTATTLTEAAVRAAAAR